MSKPKIEPSEILSFSSKVAKKYGSDCAVLIWHLQFWIAKNLEKGRNCHDGRTWTYQTYEDLAERFPHLSKDQVYNKIKKLVAAGVLIKGNYNKNKNDRTTWYAFADQDYWLKEKRLRDLKNNKNGADSRRQRSRENTSPLPDRTTDRETDVKHQRAHARRSTPRSTPTTTTTVAKSTTLTHDERQKSLATCRSLCASMGIKKPTTVPAEVSEVPVAQETDIITTLEAQEAEASTETVEDTGADAIVEADTSVDTMAQETGPQVPECGAEAPETPPGRGSAAGMGSAGRASDEDDVIADIGPEAGTVARSGVTAFAEHQEPTQPEQRVRSGLASMFIGEVMGILLSQCGSAPPAQAEKTSGTCNVSKQ